jgi:hypothetical protein
VLQCCGCAASWLACPGACFCMVFLVAALGFIAFLPHMCHIVDMASEEGSLNTRHVCYYGHGVVKEESCAKTAERSRKQPQRHAQAATSHTTPSRRRAANTGCLTVQNFHNQFNSVSRATRCLPLWAHVCPPAALRHLALGRPLPLVALRHTDGFRAYPLPG